jgi:hypothetical protein
MPENVSDRELVDDYLKEKYGVWDYFLIPISFLSSSTVVHSTNLFATWLMQ